MQPKNKPLKRRKYDAIFKTDVLKMIANGQSVPYVAQALGISEALIYNRDGGPLETAKQRGRKTPFFEPNFGRTD
jgi:transposase-like protein